MNPPKRLVQGVLVTVVMAISVVGIMKDHLPVSILVGEDSLKDDLTSVISPIADEKEQYNPLQREVSSR